MGVTVRPVRRTASPSCVASTRITTREPGSRCGRPASSASENSVTSNCPVGSESWTKAKRLPRADLRSCREATEPAILAMQGPVLHLQDHLVVGQHVLPPQRGQVVVERVAGEVEAHRRELLRQPLGRLPVGDAGQARLGQVVARLAEQARPARRRFWSWIAAE